MVVLKESLSCSRNQKSVLLKWIFAKYAGDQILGGFDTTIIFNFAEIKYDVHLRVLISSPDLTSPVHIEDLTFSSPDSVRQEFTN